MIREAEGTPARVFARFGECFSLPPRSSARLMYNFVEKGVERHVEVDGLNEGEVASRVAELLGLAAKK